MSDTYDLTPDGVQANDSWTNQASVGTQSAILAALTDGSTATYITANTSAATRSIRFAYTALAPTVRGITRVQIRTVCKSTNATQVGTLQPYLYVGGTRYNGTSRTRSASLENWVTLTDNWSVNPKTTEPWTKGDIASLQAGLEQGIDPSFFWQVDEVGIRVTYVPASGDLERVREIGSRELERRRRSRVTIGLRVPLSLGAQLAPSDRLAVEHWAAVGGNGAAYGEQDWSRGQLRVLSRRIQPEGAVELECEEWQPLLLYDSGGTPLTPGGIEDGVARIRRGNTRTFTRTSLAWVPDPVSGLVYAVDPDVPKYAEGSIAIHEAEGVNYLLDSSNNRGQSSSTGWTTRTSITDGTGALFEDGVTANTYAFNASTDLLQQTTGTLPQHVCLSLDHLCSGSDAIRWSAQRASDSKWFKASDSTWDAAEQNNAVTASATFARQAWHMDLGGATTLLVKIKGPSSGTAELAHAQLEAGYYPTSRIVTTSATETRTADSLTYAWATATRLLWATQGGCSVRFTPDWSAADVPSGKRTLLYVAHDADNVFRFGYDQAYGLTLEIEAATVVTRAYQAWSPVAGTEYVLGARWCSSRGEQGLAAYSLQTCLDGVLGTAVAAAASMTEASSGTLEVGSAAGADHCDGGWRELRITQRVPTEVELQRGLR